MDNYLSERIQRIVPALPGWCTPEKATAMATQILLQKPKTVVEVGIFGGRSFLPLVWAVAENRYGYLYAVDPWSAAESIDSVQEQANVDWWGGLDHEQIYQGFLEVLGTHCTSAEREPIQILRVTSQEAAGQFADGQVDFLHIDGNHSEVKSQQDLDLWLPKLAPGGILVFDDINWSSVAAALQRIRAELHIVNEDYTYGIYRKPLPGESVAALPSCWFESQLYSPTFFSTIEPGSQACADALAPLLLSSYPIQSVVDVGCGTGVFLEAFRRLGVGDIRGIDGSYVPLDQLKIPQDNFLAMDLKDPGQLDESFDLALCLEVAEHLPESSANALVEFLCGLSDLICFSAATPGQGGDGHINEQPLYYWKEKFAWEGFEIYDELRESLKVAPGVPSWYWQNTYLFKKISAGYTGLLASSTSL